MYESAIKAKNAKAKENQKLIRRQKRNVEKKLRKTKMGVMKTIAFVSIICVLLVSLWSNLIEAGRKKERIAAMEQQYDHKRILNDALKQKVDASVDDEEYIVEIARENGLRRSDEILFDFYGN